MVAGSRGWLALTLLVASAACTSDFDGLFSQGGGTSVKPDASAKPALPDACPNGKNCDVSCDGTAPCDYSCPAGTSCNVKCVGSAQCTCTGSGCVMSCDVKLTTCGTTTACNVACK